MAIDHYIKLVCHLEGVQFLKTQIPKLTLVVCIVWLHYIPGETFIFLEGENYLPSYDMYMYLYYRCQVLVLFRMFPCIVLLVLVVNVGGE